MLATGAPTFEALRERERLNLLGVILRALGDSVLQSDAFKAMLRPSCSDAGSLWYARAVAAVGKVVAAPCSRPKTRP